MTYANVVVTLLAFVVLAGSGALAATNLVGSDGQIHGCVKKKGNLILIKPGAKCKKGSPIAWNQQGPQGPRGQNGSGANIQPEAIHAIGVGNESCDTQAGTFCSNNDHSTCQNWENYSPTIGGNYVPGGFFKDAEGIVHLRGRVDNAVSGCAAGGPPVPDAIFFLPPGYRPAGGTEEFAAFCGTTPFYVEISIDGRVKPANENELVCANLSGITFRAGG